MGMVLPRFCRFWWFFWFGWVCSAGLGLLAWASCCWFLRLIWYLLYLGSASLCGLGFWASCRWWVIVCWHWLRTLLSVRFLLGLECLAFRFWCCRGLVLSVWVFWWFCCFVGCFGYYVVLQVWIFLVGV